MMSLYRVLSVLLISALVVSSSRVEPAEPESQAADWPYDDARVEEAIRYIRPEIPAVSVEPYQGQSYAEMAPDTLELADMAALSINVLTGATNASQDHEQYFSLYIGNPLRMAHNFSDWCTPKYMEALPLLRTVTRATYRDQVDRVWMETTLKSIGPDGLYYFPLIGKPWYSKEFWWAKGIARADGTIFETEKPDEAFKKTLDTYAVPHAHTIIAKSGIEQFTHPQPCGRMLNVMLIYYLRDGNPVWKQTIERMIDRLLELAIHEDDYCYFPSLYYEPNAKYDPNDPKVVKPQGLQAGEINGRLGEGCGRFYRLTGYEPARELGEKLSRFMRAHSGYFAEDGEFLAEKHFHAGTIYLLNMLEVADATGDRDLLQFVQRCFEWARSPAAGTAPITGFIPEFTKPYRTSEGCAVADMIALALKLSGAGDYYELAERWARNHFSEMQMTPTKADYLVRRGKSMEAKTLLYNETMDNVVERNIGGFSSWCKGNEWWGNDERGTDNLVMHCCTGNATRTVYYLWQDILDHSDGVLRINMLLNRASPWADVHSHVPYRGQVDIKMKQACEAVKVHAPEWIGTGGEQITVRVNDQPRAAAWEGRYLNVGNASAGDLIQIEFPISERIEQETIGEEEFTLIVRGNTVVSIDPPGRICPLYNRDHLRETDTRWREVERFVADPDQLIDW